MTYWTLVAEWAALHATCATFSSQKHTTKDSTSGGTASDGAKTTSHLHTRTFGFSGPQSRTRATDPMRLCPLQLSWSSHTQMSHSTLPSLIRSLLISYQMSLSTTSTKSTASCDPVGSCT